MFKTLRNAWSIPDLRRKLLFTLLIIIIYRIGGAIPVPFLNNEVLREWAKSSSESGDIFSYLNVLSGGNFSKATILSLSISPYINAQIIIQLLTYALPPLERMAKEGMEGRKKINKITKYSALGIAIFQAWAYYLTMKKQGALVYTSGRDKIFSEIVIIACFTAGASLIIWLGDRINEKGIGNGISMILFAGIVARGPIAVWELITLMRSGEAKYMVMVPITIVLFVAMIGFIVFMNEAERRIHIQYAKRVVGNKMYGGQSSYIPIKICMSGVLPIIFAMSFMSIPATIKMFKDDPGSGASGFGWLYHNILKIFSYDHWAYALIYFLLIIGFNYFYVSMQYNPIEIANNLRQSNGAIQGIRPGRPTSDYIKRVMSKITFVGAFFLGFIAVLPIVMANAVPGMNIAIGGSSILIVVSVALETVRTLESQMMMRHHKGFLE